MSMRAEERRRQVTFVVKRLQGDHVREAAVYRWLTAGGCAHLAPACFAIEPAADEGHWLFLEALRPVMPWPWREVGHVSSVVDRAGGIASIRQRPRLHRVCARL
jgi:hypothetical protein